MITRSLLLWSVNDFDDGCFFLLFSLDLNPTEHINWQITRLRMGCLMILSLAVFSAFIVFKSFPQQNHSSYFILLHFQTFFMVLNVFLHLTHIYMLILLTLNSLEMTDDWSKRHFLSVIFIVLSFKKPLYAGGGGEYFRNSWAGMRCWDPGTLNLYQSWFSLILLPYTRVNSPNLPYPRVAVFQKPLRSVAQSSQNKTLYHDPLSR